MMIFVVTYKFGISNDNIQKTFDFYSNFIRFEATELRKNKDKLFLKRLRKIASLFFEKNRQFVIWELYLAKLCHQFTK